MVLVIYSAWSSPFELAFKKVATGSLLYVDLVVDFFFVVDIFLTFFVAYLDKSTYLLVDDHQKIATRYPKQTILNVSKTCIIAPWHIIVGSNMLYLKSKVSASTMSYLISIWIRLTVCLIYLSHLT